MIFKVTIFYLGIFSKMSSYPALLLILADRVRSIIALVVPVTDELGEISAEVERDAADVLCAVPDRTFIAIGTLL